MAIDMVESSNIDYLVGDLIKERPLVVRLHKIKDSNLNKNPRYPDSEDKKRDRKDDQKIFSGQRRVQSVKK
jgi:hypothetical protein